MDAKMKNGVNTGANDTKVPKASDEYPRPVVQHGT